MVGRSTSMREGARELYSGSRFLLPFPTKRRRSRLQDQPDQRASQQTLRLMRIRPSCKAFPEPRTHPAASSRHEPCHAATTTVPLTRLTQGSTYPAFFCSVVSPSSTSI